MSSAISTIAKTQSTWSGLPRGLLLTAIASRPRHLSSFPCEDHGTMTNVDVRPLSSSLENGTIVTVFTRGGITYAGSPVALRIDTAYGRLGGEVVMRLSPGTMELIDFGEIVQVRVGAHQTH